MDTPASVQFFAFGCWNLLGCSGNEHLRKNVENIKANNYKFGIILGDNIYNPKRLGITKKEPYKLETLLDGMSCINNIGVPMYVVLGNHDVEQCDMLQYQLYKQAQNIQPVDLSNWIIPKNYYSKMLSFHGLNIKLIVIDTNLLGDKKVSMYNRAYCNVGEKIINSTNEMLQFLADELNDSENKDADWIIIAGHLPMASIREKATTNIQKMPYSDYNSVYQAIYNSAHRRKVLYICADTHNFQHNVLTYREYNLNELVIGTGGAAPDYVKNTPTGSIFDIYPKENPEYKLTFAEYFPAYGYGEFTVDKNNIDVSYVTSILLNKGHAVLAA